METEKKIKMLQMFYAAALTDSVLRLHKEGVLDKVTAEKKREQLASGKIRAAQLGIESSEQVFSVLSDIFGCANWTTVQAQNGFSAKASNCMLCAMAKRVGAPSPCSIYCLDAMEGMVKGLSPDADYRVESTLFDGTECRVSVVG